MILQQEQLNRIYELLTTKGKCTIIGLGTIYLLPRRKGLVYGFGKDRPIKYNKRISLKPSIRARETLCK